MWQNRFVGVSIVEARQTQREHFAVLDVVETFFFRTFNARIYIIYSLSCSSELCSFSAVNFGESRLLVNSMKITKSLSYKWKNVSWAVIVYFNEESAFINGFMNYKRNIIWASIFFLLSFNFRKGTKFELYSLEHPLLFCFIRIVNMTSLLKWISAKLDVIIYRRQIWSS